MIKVNYQNKNIVITQMKNSNFRWAFILNSRNEVESARVVPPQMFEYGGQLNLNTFSEEEVSQWVSQPYNEDNQNLKQRILEVDEALSKNYGFRDETQGKIWNSVVMRTVIVKSHLKVDDDEEYSTEHELNALLPIGEATLNYKLRPISIRFPVVPELDTQEEANQKVNHSESTNPLKKDLPKKAFEG